MQTHDDLKSLITDEMRACIGRTSPVRSMPEEIASSDIRRYVEAIGETNPLWTDDEFARSLGYKGRRVPPLLVTQFRWRIEDREEGEHLAESEWSGLVYPDGYTSFRNAGQEVEWLAPVYVGDILSYQSKLTDIFVRQGKAGPLIFTKTENEIRNQDGVVVVRSTSTGARMRAARHASAPKQEA